MEVVQNLLPLISFHQLEILTEMFSNYVLGTRISEMSPI